MAGVEEYPPWMQQTNPDGSKIKECRSCAPLCLLHQEEPSLQHPSTSARHGLAQGLEANQTPTCQSSTRLWTHGWSAAPHRPQEAEADFGQGWPGWPYWACSGMANSLYSCWLSLSSVTPALFAPGPLTIRLSFPGSVLLLSPFSQYCPTLKLFSCAPAL